MQIGTLSPEVLETLSRYRYDRIYEKHEGPWEYDYLLQSSRIEFLTVEGYDVLLPIDKEHYPNITFTRCIIAADRQTLTLFFRDTTYSDGYPDWFAGYMAICERFPNAEWYLAFAYHECWIDRLVEYQPVG